MSDKPSKSHPLSDKTNPTKLNSPSTEAASGAPSSILSTNGKLVATIKNADMSEEMQKETVKLAQAATETYTVEKEIAAYIKKEYDRIHGPTWHVVVGKNFGSYVTHETRHFIYFYLGPQAYLIWKS